jgi:acyl-CoA reductase-like NAD-dependent aldehyde dehydrogenase
MQMDQTTEVRAYIAGEWREGTVWRDNIDPADTRLPIGRAMDSTDADVDTAVASAVEAQRLWGATPAPQRAQLLFGVIKLLEDRAEQVARTISREMGKTLAEARGEVAYSLDVLHYFSGEGKRISGTMRPSGQLHTLCYAVRQPLGVVGVITPWNFPLVVPVWKIAPALVAGNNVVFKPSELTPLTGKTLVDIFVDAGVPPGVLNFIPGPGETTGQRLVTHTDVAALTFTGSTEIGQLLARQAAAGQKKFQGEMGGKNALVVLSDANLELAAMATVAGGFGSTGQRCTATSRVLATKDIYTQFVDLVIDKAKSIRVGHPMQDGVQMGPSVDKQQYERVHEYITIGKGEATLGLGGHKLTQDALAYGYYTDPTVFVDVPPEARIAQEEIFGPVLTMIPVDTLDQAIEVVNSTTYGLSTSIYTHDLTAVHRFIDAVEVGIVHVNRPTVGAEAQLPIGGLKASGCGDKEMGQVAAEFYSQSKTVFIDYGG